MSDAIIKVSNLGKCYTIKHQAERQRYTALRDVIAEKAKDFFKKLKSGNSENLKTGNDFSMSAFQHVSVSSAPPAQEDFWALKDVSFEVKQGEVVGIIGRNGAGKSTLLKILSRITEPTTGRVEIDGRVASLLEVGTGFHPELTGRENIYLNGAILGMHRAEIKRKFDEIVAFAEVEKFLDTPVKRYSSGMYVRLAFAVAAHLEPEILIVDEVLAVGDAGFQKKCLGKMQDASKKEGRTVLFVSHNMGVVSTLTERCIYLQDGQITASGDSRNIVEMYLRRSAESSRSQTSDISQYRRDQTNDSPVKISGISISGCNPDSGALPTVEIGEMFAIEVHLEVYKKLQGALVAVTLKTSRGERATVLLSWDQEFALFLEPGKHTVIVRILNLPLAPGQYFVDVGINQAVETKAYEVILDFPLFCITNHGQVTHWLDRPWGVMHCMSVEWSNIKVNGGPK